mmetsp:Transcript_14195/g.44378  ORF Transcript_14195/g.44378 Transcript_14195/m.44378 type:complete len:325 (+) Transcript_14195:123-1097(+)
MVSSSGRLSKLSLVTPSVSVSCPPRKPELTAPELQMDMSNANSVASTPSGHTRAASTSTGMKATCPTTASATLSATAKASLGMPIDSDMPVTSSSCVRLSAVPTSADHRKTVRSGLACNCVLNSTTPARLANAVASCTRPRNSGVKPSRSVWKKNMACGALGVACHRNRNAVGDQISRRRTALHISDACRLACSSACATPADASLSDIRSSSSTKLTRVTSSGRKAVTENTNLGPYSSTSAPPQNPAAMEPTARAPQLRLCRLPSRLGSCSSRTRSTTTLSTTTSAIATPTELSSSPPITVALVEATVASAAQPAHPASPHTAI